MSDVRTCWVSGKAHDIWKPRIDAILSAWSKVELSRFDSLHTVDKQRFEAIENEADLHGKKAVVLETCGYREGYAIASQPGSNGLRVAITNRPEEWKNAWEGNSRDSVVGHLLGYPQCCIDFFNGTWAKGSIDPTWEMALNSSVNDHQPGTLLIDKVIPPANNILFRWLGPRLVSHLPCSFHCEETLKIGSENAVRFAELGFKEEFYNLAEILSWPVEWSNLHGFAEIKTPITKTVAKSNYVPQKLIVRKLGNKYPKEGAMGLDFPFRKSNVDNWTGNGFPSPETMEEAHKPILDMVGMAVRMGAEPGAIVDLGCGNAALLDKIHNIFPALLPIGFEVDPERAKNGQSLYPSIPIFNVNMFDPKLHYQFEIAIVMPGRLTEVTQDKVWTLLENLKGRFLICYAYADWLDQGLMNLCEKSGILDKWITVESAYNHYGHSGAILMVKK